MADRSNIKPDARLLVESLPESGTWDDLAYKVYVREAIEVGLADADARVEVQTAGGPDRWILATAIAGAADVLVTGDQDLVVVAAKSPVRILDPRAFWELLRANA